jgi:HD-GYP domain-containing protein (c-di-GMP phosphodiesterase class II)
MSIADAYDAMTTDRAYRPALPEEEARAEIRRFSGTQFDPEIVSVFFSIVEQVKRERISFANDLHDEENSDDDRRPTD